MTPVGQTKADRQGAVDAVHRFGSDFAHPFAQSLFVNRPYLLQQNGRILDKTAALRVQFDMGREFCFITLTGDGSSDHSRTVSVSDIILDN